MDEVEQKNHFFEEQKENKRTITGKKKKKAVRISQHCAFSDRICEQKYMLCKL